MTPLMEAVKAAPLKDVEALLAEGASVSHVDGDGRTALVHALCCKPLRLPVVKALLDAGADPNLGMPPPLKLALETPQADAALLLLHHGARVTDHAWLRTAFDRFSSQPLMVALCAAGGDVNHVHDDGFTLVTHAADAKMMPARLEQLLACGADVQRADARGYTALMRAASLGQVLLVRRLLEAGARADSVDAQGRTAWDLADAAGHRAAANMLRLAGPV